MHNIGLSRFLAQNKRKRKRNRHSPEHAHALCSCNLHAVYGIRNSLALGLAYQYLNMRLSMNALCQILHVPFYPTYPRIIQFVHLKHPHVSFLWRDSNKSRICLATLSQENRFTFSEPARTNLSLNTSSFASCFMPFAISSTEYGSTYRAPFPATSGNALVFDVRTGMPIV